MFEFLFLSKCHWGPYLWHSEGDFQAIGARRGGGLGRKSVPSPHTDPACVEEVPTLPRGGDYRIQIGKYTFMGDCWKVDKDNFCLTLSWPMFARCSTPCFCGILRLFWIIHFFTSFLCLPLYSWSEGTLLSVLPIAWIFNSLCVPSLCRVCAYIIPTKSLKVSFCKRFSKHIM